jgi:hypothetical protein
MSSPNGRAKTPNQARSRVKALGPQVLTIAPSAPVTTQGGGGGGSGSHRRRVVSAGGSPHLSAFPPEAGRHPYPRQWAVRGCSGALFRLRTKAPARPHSQTGCIRLAGAWERSDQRFPLVTGLVRLGQATPASLSEYFASACEPPVRPDRSDESGPGTSSNRQGPRTGVDLTGGER